MLKHFHKKIIHKKMSARLASIFRNCDFIVLREGITWQQNTEGVEFLDSENLSSTSVSSLEFATGTDIPTGIMATLYS